MQLQGKGYISCECQCLHHFHISLDYVSLAIHDVGGRLDNVLPYENQARMSISGLPICAFQAFPGCFSEQDADLMIG